MFCNAEAQSHWMSESGVADLMLLPGPTPSHVFQQIMKLTGVFLFLPQLMIACVCMLCVHLLMCFCAKVAPNCLLSSPWATISVVGIIGE